MSTFRRSDFLVGLLEALGHQTLPAESFEIIIVDNGSGDETWPVLEKLVAHAEVRLLVTTLPENRGPGGGRNHGFRFVRAPVAAITDDDCLPTPGWLAAMQAAFESGADIVQGQVHADPVDEAAAGPWDHTKWITEATPFFETSNVAYRVALFVASGGFDEGDALTARISGRAFGEDALVAWRMQRAGGRATFADASVVHHRNVPCDYRHLLKTQRNLVSFPGLGNRSPLVAQWFWHRIFLGRETARFDLAAVSILGAAATRKPWLGLGALPWAYYRWPDASRRAGGNRSLALVRLAQLAIADGVSLVSLLEGSVRHKRLLL